MSKKKGFEVGQRVAVYGGIPGTRCEVRGARGVVMYVADNNDVTVRFDKPVDSISKWNLYPQQRRRSFVAEEGPDWGIHIGALRLDRGGHREGSI